MIDTDTRVMCDGDCGTVITFPTDALLFRKLTREGWILDEEGERQYCSEECAQANGVFP